MLRLTCSECSHRFLLRLNRKELTLEREAAEKSSGENEAYSY